MRFNWVAASLVVLSFSASARADGPMTVGLNGMLFQEGQCAPYCGNWSCSKGTFQLFDSASAGNPVGQPIEANLECEGGWFHAEVAIDPRNLDKDAWVQIELDGLATVAQRVRLTAVPWALRVADLSRFVGPAPVSGGAATITSSGSKVTIDGAGFGEIGLSAGDFVIPVIEGVRKAGAFVAGIDSDTQLTLDGPFPDGNVNGVFFLSQRPIASFFTNDEEVAAAGLHIGANGWTGIRTLAPRQPLDVDGDAHFRGSVGIGSLGNGTDRLVVNGGIDLSGPAEETFITRYSSAGAPGPLTIRFRNGAGANRPGIKLQTSNYSGTYVDRLVVNSDCDAAHMLLNPNGGYVGIGIAGPAATLHVANQESGTQLALENAGHFVGYIGVTDNNQLAFSDSTTGSGNHMTIWGG